MSQEEQSRRSARLTATCLGKFWSRGPWLAIQLRNDCRCLADPCPPYTRQDGEAQDYGGGCLTGSRTDGRDWANDSGVGCGYASGGDGGCDCDYDCDCKYVCDDHDDCSYVNDGDGDFDCVNGFACAAAREALGHDHEQFANLWKINVSIGGI